MAKVDKKIERQIKGLIRAADRAENSAAKRVVSLLADARKEIAASVASTEWQMYRLPQLKAAVDRAMSEFGTQFGVDMTETQNLFWTYGVERVDAPLRAVKLMTVIPDIDTSALLNLQEYGLDKVKGLSADAARRINNEISLGLMGDKSPYDVMQAVGRSIDDPGIFKSLATRAETIVRNEAGRALERAGQERKAAAAKVVPGLQKQWIYGHSPRRPRLTHVAADGQVRDVGEPFDIAGEKLMYPRDPAGSPENTINCG